MPLRHKHQQLPGEKLCISNGLEFCYSQKLSYQVPRLVFSGRGTPASKQMPRVTQECDFTIHEDEPSVCSSVGGDGEEAGNEGRESVGGQEGESYLEEEPAAEGVADGDEQPGDARRQCIRRES